MLNFVWIFDCEGFAEALRVSEKSLKPAIVNLLGPQTVENCHVKVDFWAHDNFAGKYDSLTARADSLTARADSPTARADSPEVRTKERRPQKPFRMMKQPLLIVKQALLTYRRLWIIIHP